MKQCCILHRRIQIFVNVSNNVNDKVEKGTRPHQNTFGFRKGASNKWSMTKFLRAGCADTLVPKISIFNFWCWPPLVGRQNLFNVWNKVGNKIIINIFEIWSTTNECDNVSLMRTPKNQTSSTKTLGPFNGDFFFVISVSDFYLPAHFNQTVIFNYQHKLDISTTFLNNIYVLWVKFI